MTPTTRELLEGAARAAGIEGSWREGAQCFWTKKKTVWRPHQDMADCFEMETALGINIRWHKDCIEVWHGAPVSGHLEAFSDHNNRKAARMYASTLCAYEIGKGMR
ncbi:MAG TPA: hypothetical protein VFM33_01140 [Aquabacterium sp.]|nr:hypothetical protein [Aquabacterium sp.]